MNELHFTVVVDKKNTGDDIVGDIDVTVTNNHTGKFYKNHYPSFDAIGLGLEEAGDWMHKLYKESVK